MPSPSALIAHLQHLARSDRPALIAADGARTYLELMLDATDVARSLMSGQAIPESGRRGLSLNGARVGLLMAPSIQWVTSFLGILLAGGVVVPLSPLHPEAEVRYFAQDASLIAVLLDEAHQDRRAWFGDVPVLHTGDREFAARTRASSGMPRPQSSDGALLLYTSGTTGKPKGALLTHDNLDVQARLLGEAWGMREDDRLLHALPLHHMHGVVIALLTALRAGGAVELLPRFVARDVWEAMGRSTVWMGVPTMYHKLLEAHDQASDDERARWTGAARALRLATSGSAALPVTMAERWRALSGVIPLERFGMTELGVALSNPLAGERKPGKVGRPLPGVEVRVVDEQSRDVRPGESGEIVVRGPTVFAGYLGREDATQAAFRDGWFLTGDTATVDDDGYVKILGRTSVDILKSGGYKLSSLEIEEALREHPAVAEVAVVGLLDEVWGERVGAAVVLRHGASLTSEQLQAFCREQLAPYKVPRAVWFASELPRNAMGKVMKPELVRRWGAG